MPSKVEAISKLLSQVLEDSDHLKPYMFSTMEELIKHNPTKKGMTVKEWANNLKPGTVLKRRDQETGKLAQFNLNSEELKQSGFNKLLETDPGRHVTKDELLDLLTPYEVKFDKPKSSWKHETNGLTMTEDEARQYNKEAGREVFAARPEPKYPGYKNFDSVINGAMGKATNGANRLTFEDFVRAHGDNTHPQGQHINDTVEMIRDLIEDNYVDVDIEDLFGTSGLPRNYRAMHRAFQENPRVQELAYDNYISMFDDFADDIMGANAEALPEFLTKDTRAISLDDPLSHHIQGSMPVKDKDGRRAMYPAVSGKHFTDNTISHSRVNRAPILGDSDYVLSEVQSDLEPYIKQVMDRSKKEYDNVTYIRGEEPNWDAKEWAKVHYPGIEFLEQAPFLSEYPRIEMNRTLAEALADAKTPDHLIYNNAFDANPSAPELMYMSRLPKEFQRLSRSYDIPLTNTKQELAVNMGNPEKWDPNRADLSIPDVRDYDAQQHFSGALPVKKDLEYLRRIGVPFLSNGTLALLLANQGRDE